MKADELATLTKAFVETATMHFHSTSVSKGIGYKEANRNARRMTQIFHQIVAFGNAGRQALLALTNHSDPAVAAMAAVYSLNYAPDVALPVLSELSKHKGMLGFRCEQAIERWNNGKWQLDDDEPPVSQPQRPVYCMTNENLDALLQSLPRQLSWEQIPERDRFDERRSLVDVSFQNIVGVMPGGICWSPNDSPPSREEGLGFLWLTRPDLGPQIAKETGNSLFREVIEEYNSSD